MLYIENKVSEIHNVAVYALMGKLLTKTERNSNERKMSKMPKGMFFVKVETERSTETQKIIKQ